MITFNDTNKLFRDAGQPSEEYALFLRTYDSFRDFETICKKLPIVSEVGVESTIYESIITIQDLFYHYCYCARLFDDFLRFDGFQVTPAVKINFIDEAYDIVRPAKFLKLYVETIHQAEADGNLASRSDSRDYHFNEFPYD